MSAKYIEKKAMSSLFLFLPCLKVSDCHAKKAKKVINKIRMSFIARYVYTNEEFVFMTEATTVQQNDSDRTKKTDNKNN